MVDESRMCGMPEIEVVVMGIIVVEPADGCRWLSGWSCGGSEVRKKIKRGAAAMGSR
jgi:hypothetical protein